MTAQSIRVRTRPTAVPLDPERLGSSSHAERHLSIDIPPELSLKVVYRPLDTLRPSPRNARTHSQKQIAKIEASVRRFGFVRPILVTSDGEIIAGAGVSQAARNIGQRDVPTICLDHLTEAEVRAYRLADNKLAELAGWDEEILKIEFGELLDIDIELGEVIGFETAEIDIILDGGSLATKRAKDPADEVPEVEEGVPPVSRTGDLWMLGKHRLICGNAREQETFARLMQGEMAQIAILDPPYNCPINGHVSGTGRHREFAEASGEMSRTEFLSFLTTTLSHTRDASEDGSLHYVFMDWRGLQTLLQAGEVVYDELKNVITWVKSNAGLGSLYRSQSEFVACFKKGKAPHTNNIELGRHGRYRTNCWFYDGANAFGRGRDGDLASHPTPKSVAMIMDAIKDASKPGGIVLDAFGGGGTTLIAAEKTRRSARLIEIDPAYVDVTVKRFEKLFKDEVRLAETGLTFAEVRHERGASHVAASRL